MSYITEQLLKEVKALSLDDDTKVAVGHLKQAGIADDEALELVIKQKMEDSAVASLVDNGLEKSAAEVEVSNELNGVKIVNIIPDNIISLLEKAAQEIFDLEQQVQELGAKIEKKASEVEEELPESLDKLAGLGYSQDELEALRHVPESVLEKIAGSVSKPWDLGEAVGIPRDKTDPLLEFCLKGTDDY